MWQNSEIRRPNLHLSHLNYKMMGSITILQSLIFRGKRDVKDFFWREKSNCTTMKLVGQHNRVLKLQLKELPGLFVLTH